MVVALLTAELECCRQTQRYGDDRIGEIALVLVLMERQARTRLIAIDEACVGTKLRIAGFRCRGHRQIEEAVRHGRPRIASLGVYTVVAISTPIGDPSGSAAIGHGDGHRIAAGGGHVPERGYGGDVA